MNGYYTKETDMLSRAASRADRVIVLSDGRLLLDGTPAEVFAQPEILETAYVQPTDVTRIAQALPYMPDDVISVDEFFKAFNDAMKEEV